MIDQTTPDGKIITAAFDLAASPGWQEISLRDIADAAGVSLADVMQHYETKADILKAFVNHVDRAMLAAAGDVEREQSPRDAVFEVVMSRFDLMVPFRVGLKSIAKDTSTLLSDPGMIRLALKSQNRILQAAGISIDGGPALLRQLGLARVYGQVFQIWLEDDDAGMARTMAALDKRLRQGEQTLRTIDDVAQSMDQMRERVGGMASKVASQIFAGVRSATASRGGRSTSSDDADASDATGTDATSSSASSADGDNTFGNGPAPSAAPN